MNILFRYKVIIGIFCIAAVLRLWQLGNVPPSPDWDETALGYNAFSILKTGRDEYGTWFPLSLRSFDDYKPPLYMYLAVPFIAVFGLDTWVVRLPSAAGGIVAVFGVYAATRELLKRSDKQAQKKYEWLPAISSLFLAISPWHIQFSRIAFEANVGITLNIIGIACLLRGLRNGKWLVAGSVFWALGLYAYHSERIFLPLLALVFFFVFWQDLVRQRKYLFWAVITGMLVAAPLIPVLLNKTTLTRLRGTSSLADQTLLLSRSVRKLEEDQKTGNPLGVVFDNRRIVWARTLLSGYLSHYSFRWLFLTGDNPRHHAPDMGLLYIVELPFILWGLYAVAIVKERWKWFLLGWFVLAPVAASPTTELPHAIRTLVFLPVFQWMSAFGLVEFLQLLKRKNNSLRVSAIVLVSMIALVNFSYYIHMYFSHMNHEFSANWQYGYKQAALYAQSYKQKYTKVVVSTKLEQPHMFFLFYLKYDPEQYLRSGGTSSGGFAENRNAFDIYEFRPIDWEKEERNGLVLYIGTPKEISAPNLLVISYLDGTPAMHIADR